MRKRMQVATILEDTFCAVAGFHPGWQAEPTESLAIGDSSAMIPPFTGNGMTMAFQSAESALPILKDFSQGKISWEEAKKATREALRERFRRRMTAARLAHPFLTHPAGQAFLCGAARLGMLPIGTLHRSLR